MLARPAALPTVRYVGAAVAAIAATTRSAADEAIRLINVNYEVLPFVVDMDEARQPDAPRVFEAAANESGRPAASRVTEAGNVFGPTTSTFFGGPRGNVTQGFREADVIVEGEFRTQVQTHCCLEPHAIVADWRMEGLTVYISTQDTIGVRNDLAAAFGLARERVRVVTEFMGGGFGSKLSVGDYGYIAVELSRKAGAPVALVFDRSEEQQASGNRPGTWQRLRIGARRDGTLTAISLVSYGTAGVDSGAGVGSIAQAMYDCPNFEMAQHDVFIHAAPGCPMRAPGNVQGAFALEQLVDELADNLGLDPLALRDRIDPSAVRREERRIGSERFSWGRRRPAGADGGPVKRGVGVAQSFWPGIVQTSAACEVRIDRDGSIELRSSVQDIGSGIRTLLAQVVAEELGLRPEDISVRIGDTDFAPGPSSGGSKTAGSITPAARKAAYQIRQKLFAAAAPAVGVRPEDLASREGRIFARTDPSLGISFRQAAGLLDKDAVSAVAERGDNYGGFRVSSPMNIAHEELGGVQFAEVAVDTETGVVRVERFTAVHDCGRPMNPRQIESQIHGGILMGISFALFENRILDYNTGRMVNANLEHYKLLGPSETSLYRRRFAGKLSGHQRDGCMWHRRAGNHCDSGSGGERRLQCDRRPHARIADNASRGAGGARPRSGQELTTALAAGALCRETHRPSAGHLRTPRYAWADDPRWALRQREAVGAVGKARWRRCGDPRRRPFRIGSEIEEKGIRRRHQRDQGCCRRRDRARRRIGVIALRGRGGAGRA